jgi:hypothetical protein
MIPGILAQKIVEFKQGIYCLLDLYAQKQFPLFQGK